MNKINKNNEQLSVEHGIGAAFKGNSVEQLEKTQFILFKQNL